MTEYERMVAQFRASRARLARRDPTITLTVRLQPDLYDAFRKIIPITDKSLQEILVGGIVAEIRYWLDERERDIPAARMQQFDRELQRMTERPERYLVERPQ